MLSNKISIYVQMIITKINSNPIIGKWCKQRNNRQFLILDRNPRIVQSQDLGQKCDSWQCSINATGRENRNKNLENLYLKI